MTHIHIISINEKYDINEKNNINDINKLNTYIIDCDFNAFIYIILTYALTTRFFIDLAL